MADRRLRGVAAIDKQIACKYPLCMIRMLQVRNVPEETHRVLKARAAMAGMSLSEYVLKLLERSVERPTPAELRRRIESRYPVEPRVSPATLVAEERERR